MAGKVALVTGGARGARRAGPGTRSRLDGPWRGQRRDSFVLSTKVGRVLFRPADPETFYTAPWIGGLPFEHRFDYTSDGLTRAYEDSTQRLGLNRIDLVLAHDLDFRHHAKEASVSGYLDQLSAGGGWRTLEALRATGEIKGIGAGINELGMIPRFLERFDIDFFLVAMPYTLMDQAALETEFPLCAARGVGIVIGAPYASGILATGPTDGAHYRYKLADPEALEWANRLNQICGCHSVPLKAAALQFPLGHPSVAAIIPGVISANQMDDNMAMVRAPIPADLWAGLKSEGLVRANAPTP